MRCPSCNTELLHPANFCPVCGANLSSAAETGPVSQPGAAEPGNVVYLRPDEPPPASHEPDVAGAPVPPNRVPPNEHAGDYARNAPPPRLVPGPGAAAHQTGAPPPGGARVGGEPVSSHPLPPHADTARSFFEGDDTPFWSEEADRQPRVLGTIVAVLATLALLGGVVWYGAALERGFGGAEAGGLVLVSALLWVTYLSLPREQQHESLLRAHARVRRLVDERVDPLQHRTRARLVLRRERDRYRAMRDERGRRVAELGEATYRRFRTGQLDPDLQPQARRVMAIEQQMLMQDERLSRMHVAADEQRPTADAE